MISEKETITGKVNSKSSIVGELNNAVKYVDPITQEKEVTPTKEIQVVEPDKGYTGLSKVTVKPYTPIVNKKTITVNGTYKASDDNLDGYSEVEVATNSVDINDYFGNPSKYKTYSMSDTGFYVSAMSYNRICQNITKIVGPIKFLNNVNDNQSYAFAYMFQIEELPDINFPGGKNFSYMFYSDIKLKKVPNITPTKYVTNYDYFCYGCKELIEVPLMNLNNATIVRKMFDYCSSLTTLGGFQNVGNAYDTSKDENHNLYSLDFHYATDLTEQSMINVLTNLYNIATKGVKPQQVIFGTQNMAKIVSEEGKQALAQAQSFGWSVS